MKYFDFGDGLGHVPARQHTNGHGWVALSASVAPSVYVAAGARVFGHVRIFGRVRLLGVARVSGQPGEDVMPTNMFGDVLISDHAQISGNVSISGNVRVRGRAVVRGVCCLSDEVIVTGNARIEYAVLRDRVYVCDNARVVGTKSNIVLMRGRVMLQGEATIDKTQPRRRRRRRTELANEPARALEQATA